MPLINTLTAPVLGINSLLEKLQSPLLLLFRLWVAKVFFMSGLQKLNTWGDEYGVLYLFREEYNVPFLNYEVAAFLATAGELILPIFLVIGFGTRYIAIALSILNVVAVVSYYATLAKVGQVTPHIFWGAMLLTTIILVPGIFQSINGLKTNTAHLRLTVKSTPKRRGVALTKYSSMNQFLLPATPLNFTYLIFSFTINFLIRSSQ